MHLSVTEVRQFFGNGLHYFKELWNVLDFCQIVLQLFVNVVLIIQWVTGEYVHALSCISSVVGSPICVMSAGYSTHIVFHPEARTLVDVTGNVQDVGRGLRAATSASGYKTSASGYAGDLLPICEAFVMICVWMKILFFAKGFLRWGMLVR